MLRMAIENSFLDREIKNAKSEMDLAGQIDLLIKKPIEAYDHYYNFEAEIHRNLSAETQNSTSKPFNSKSTDQNKSARRDLLLYSKNVLIFFGEEKYSDNENTEMDCLKQLVLNSSSFDSVYYESIPFIMCYSSFKTRVQFYIFFRGNRFEI